MEIRQRLLTQEMSRYVLLVFIVLPLLIFLRILTLPNIGLTDAWKEYTVAVVESSPKGGESPLRGVPVLADLFETERIISADSQKVHFFNYNSIQEGTERVGLKELKDSFENGDARIDPYIRNIGGYFQGRLNGKPADVFYIPEGSSFFLREVENSLKHAQVDYYLSDRKQEGRGVLWILYLLNLVLLTLFLPGSSRLIFAVGGIVPLLGIEEFTFALFVPAVTQMIGWAVLSGWLGRVLKKHLNIGYPQIKRDLVTYGGLYILFTLSGAVVTVSFEQFQQVLLLWIAVLCGIALQVVLIFLFSQFLRRRVHRQEHILFFPVSLRWEKKVERKVLKKGLILLVTLVILPAAFALAPSENRETRVEYPQPESEPAAIGFSWGEVAFFSENLKGTKDDGAEKVLPDIADYVSHRAYQDGFFYGRDYRFPHQDEEIVLPVFKKEGSGVFRYEKVFKMFTENWYKDIIADATQNGITRILLAQDGPLTVSLGVGGLNPISPYTVIGYISIALLMFPVTIMVISKKLVFKNSFREKQQQKKGQKVA